MHQSRAFGALEQIREKEVKKSARNRDTFRNEWRSLWFEVKHMFLNYCKTTSMHGFRHIYDKKLSLREKLVWGVICFSALFSSIFFMQRAWRQSQNQTSLIQIEGIDSSINELNFPAVTVCNHNQVYKPNVGKVTENLTSAGFTDQQVNEFFQYLPILIQPFQKPKADLEIFNKMLKHLKISVKDLMRQLMQPCENFVSNCEWRGKSFNCSTIFKVVESYLGYCCAFNYQVSPTVMDQENMEKCKNFYEENNSDNEVPCAEDECPGRKRVLKVPGSGSDAGLYFRLYIEPEKYLGFTKDFLGASILIHESHNYPETEIYEQAIQQSKQKNIIVSGVKMESDEDIQQLAPEIRNCAFESELQFNYSYQSCLAKCRMIRFSEICGCIPFYFPNTCKKIANSCDFSNVQCILSNKSLIKNLEEEVKLENGRVLEKCYCPQVCMKVTYTAYNERASIFGGFRYPFITESGKRYNFSKVNVYFQDYTFIKYIRRLASPWYTTIGTLGGLFGLCIGGSFISVLEPIVHILMTHSRRAYDRKMKAKEIVKSNSKIVKRLPLKERLKRWDKRPIHNDIFMLRSDFKMYLNFQKSELVLPEGNISVSNTNMKL